MLYVGVVGGFIDLYFGFYLAIVYCGGGETLVCFGIESDEGWVFWFFLERRYWEILGLI